MDNGASSYRRFLDGDEGAFDDIMKELFCGLVFFIDRYVHNTHTAEDINIVTTSRLRSKPICICSVGHGRSTISNAAR